MLEHVVFLLEAPPGFEPGVKDLQSHALPLGYGAVVRTGTLHFAAAQARRLHIRFPVLPLQNKADASFCLDVGFS